MIINHSKVAMQWLLWQEHRLRRMVWFRFTEDKQQQHQEMALAYPDSMDSHHPLHCQHIQHAQNRGEHRIQGT